MRILIAEDDAVTRLLLERIVAGAGHEVTAVHDGVQAWHAFESGDFELVLLDWLMPGLNGIDVCRNIRASTRSDSTFVVMVTGRDSASDLIGALDAGADDYVIKPVFADPLRARLVIAEKRILQGAERKQTRAALERALQAAAVGATSVALQHEINNPLAALLANAQMAEMTDNTGELREFIAIINEQARRIADVMRRLQKVGDPRIIEYIPGSVMLDLSRPDEHAT